MNYDQILLRHNKSVVKSRSECDTSATLGKHTFAVPVCPSNMKSILTWDICREFDRDNWFYVYHRIDGPADVLEFADYAERNCNITSISIGIKEEWIKFLWDAFNRGIHLDFITLDVALSFNDNILPVLRTIKQTYPDAYVIVGNGATSEWVNWIEGLGMVDCVKVGIGVSEACRTRQYTGFGSMTLDSLIECSEMRTTDIKIMSDGGITIKDGVVCIGDINKALTAGHADFLMSGSLFSRCVDSPAITNGYFGNASKTAKQHSHHIEGELIEVVSNGLTMAEMRKLVQDSIKSGISYSGGRNIQEMKELTKYTIL